MSYILLFVLLIISYFIGSIQGSYISSVYIYKDDRVLSDKPFDLSTYSKTMFQMFSGEEADVSIEFDNELVGVVFDRFGTDIPIVKKDKRV